METKSIPSVKKFYFLEYFYVLLKSVQKYSGREEILTQFIELKKKYKLGESKYKKLTSDTELTQGKLKKYEYTFNQVVEEAREYEFIFQKKNSVSMSLTDIGKELLDVYEMKRSYQFNIKIFEYMEKKYVAFRYILEFAFKANPHKSGLLIFPVYSPRQLNLLKENITSTNDIQNYLRELQKKLESILSNELGRQENLNKQTKELFQRLKDNKLLDESSSSRFKPKDYNKIIMRIRDYWLTFFLKDIYGFEYSMSIFEQWIYRGKQIGIFHVTESYRDLRGRVFYPLAIIDKDVKNKDFKDLFQYTDGFSLYIHEPSSTKEEKQDQFVKSLVDGYYELRRTYKSYFINLIALRELICYRFKISERVFQDFLNKIYKLNLQGKLKIKISLEVDKLPEETKAIYLKREPVMVDGKYRNIIAIDVTKK